MRYRGHAEARATAGDALGRILGHRGCGGPSGIRGSPRGWKEFEPPHARTWRGSLLLDKASETRLAGPQGPRSMPDDLVAGLQYLQRPENPELHVCSSP